MKSLTKNLITGVGSLLSIFPNTNYAQLVPKQTAAERMRSHWENTGSYISKSIEQFGNEQSK
ncbi:MAG: hypothetical protein P1U35_11160 [Cycloclasticus sp.]|jgi:hypothetical protein|nr:hypothetical protein [Cycloclasticus sp.]